MRTNIAPRGHNGEEELMYPACYYNQRQKRSPEDAAKRPHLGGQNLPIYACPSPPIAFATATATATAAFDPADHIKVSCFYQVDHSKLDVKSPHQLNKIRVVMVNEKTRMRVSLRFPSIYSLRSYFNETMQQDVKKQLPAFDEKYIIGSEVAAEALYRRIPPHELAAKTHAWSFWVVKPIKVSTPPPSPDSTPMRTSTNIFVSKKGSSLMSDLQGTSMVKWGQRRQVKFLAKHVEDKREVVTLSNETVLKGKEEVEGDDDEDEDIEEQEEEVVKVVNKPIEVRRKLLKRQCRGGSNSKSTQKKKRPRTEKNQIVVYGPKKKNVQKKSIDRWSAERYKLAEVNMLKVMKKQNAVYGNPILRPDLRAEARKLIGDTGLLDHLLKHMSGKVAPGGEERFRRRHNADGAMEYWLEKANLVDVRKEAGVQDPYWTPPAGWKPGDNPTQDPVCAREIKEIKEDMAKIKKYMEEIASKKHGEELAVVALPASLASEEIENNRLLIPLKQMYIDLVNKKAKAEEQLMSVSQTLIGMEEQMEKFKLTVGGESNCTELEERQVLSGALSQEHCKSSGANTSTTPKSPARTEDKAAKIERLKSGFRMCKPHGSFLWPNMTTSSPHPQVVMQFEDLIAVPTPPSAPSSTSPKQAYLLFAPSSQNLDLTSPVKPLAEKILATIPLTTVVTSPIPCPPHENMHTQYENGISSTTAATKTPLINLNEPFNANPTDDGGSLSGSQPHGQTSSFPVTYHRRHHQNMITTAVMPSLGPTKKEMMSQLEGGDRRKDMRRYCEQKQQQRGSCCSTPPCLSMGVGSWLALATSNSSVDDKSKRG